MSKSLLFYTLDEWTDIEHYCKRRRIKPYRWENKSLDDYDFKVVTQYIKNGFVYDVLDWDKCYSGHEITLMKLPKLSYEELMSVALNSKHSDERAGAVGMILKEYSDKFEELLLKCIEAKETVSGKEKQLTRMVKFINEHVRKSISHMQSLDRTMLLCEGFLDKEKIRRKDKCKRY